MDPEVEFVLMRFFHEIPNKSAATAALVLLAVVSVAITYVTIKTRCYYMATVAITGFLEMGGYAVRVSMLSKPNLNLFIMHQALLIIPPVLLAIVEYITVSRLIALTAMKNNPGSQQKSPFATRVAWAFTISDIFCLLLQTSGGGMAGNPGTMDVARTLLLAGLGTQLGFFAIFCGITIYVHHNESFGYSNNSTGQFKYVFVCLYATIVLMYIRNIFRVVEFAQGYFGYLATHEIFLYIFDFMPIYACFLCFAFMHYGFFLGRDALAKYDRLGDCGPGLQKNNSLRDTNAAQQITCGKSAVCAIEMPIAHVYS